MCTVRLEQTGDRELTKAVTHHVFGGVNGNEVLAIVHEEGVPNEVRGDHRAASPSFDRLFGAGFIELVNLVEQGLLNKRSFFE